jgi:hypothetical protein
MHKFTLEQTTEAQSRSTISLTSAPDGGGFSKSHKHKCFVGTPSAVSLWTSLCNFLKLLDNDLRGQKHVAD